MMGMEGAFLEEVGAVPKADTLRRKEVQLNTRMHFTQRRCAPRACLQDLFVACFGRVCGASKAAWQVAMLASILRHAMQVGHSRIINLSSGQHMGCWVLPGAVM